MNNNPPKTAQEIFPHNSMHDWYDYTPIVESFGDIVIMEYMGSYQGDAVVLLKREGLWGFLIFGYGSCSGCDALQGCSTWEDVNDLIESMWLSIVWGTPKEIIDHMNREHLSWYTMDKEYNTIKLKIEELLSGVGDEKGE